MCDHADATSQLPLSGGLLMTVWLLAADHLKMNFPMAWAASVLAWGFIEFQDVSSSHLHNSIHAAREHLSPNGMRLAL